MNAKVALSGSVSSITSLASSLLLFFFSSRRRHTRLVSDWSSDVCSSDLAKLNTPCVQHVVNLRICVRIDEQHRLAAFFQVLPDCRSFLRKERLLGSGQHKDIAIRGHVVRGYEVDALDLLVLVLEHLVHHAVTVAFIGGRQFLFSVAFYEADILNAVASDLDDRVDD